jgi:iron-sulfur cluster assembly protein
MSDPGLQVSDAALMHIRKNIKKMTTNPKPIGIRINIKKAGCSGYEYVLEFAHQDSIQPMDLLFTFDDVTLVVDKAIYQKFLKGGTRMDFQKEGMKEGLMFDNPNVANQCGCGESFTLVDESLPR